MSFIDSIMGRIKNTTSNRRLKFPANRLKRLLECGRAVKFTNLDEAVREGSYGAAMNILSSKLAGGLGHQDILSFEINIFSLIKKIYDDQNTSEFMFYITLTEECNGLKDVLVVQIPKLVLVHNNKSDMEFCLVVKWRRNGNAWILQTLRSHIDLDF